MSRRARIGANIIPQSFSITPGADGAYSANSLSPANATNAAGTASTVSSRRRLLATSLNNFTYASIGQSRDQEVTSQAGRMEFFLRLTDAGAAYVVFVDTTGINGTTGLITISRVTGVSESSSSYATSATIWSNGACNSTVTGFPVSAATGTVTVGCSGFEIYIKLDGVKRVSLIDFHHCVKGRTAIRSTAGYHQLAPTITFFSPASMYSNLDNTGSGIFNLRDFGLKEVRTTGSITASDTSLTVADGSNIAVGDYVVVVVGGESGLGQRGTKGVGGSWPALVYADHTAMLADTTQANNTYAGQLSDGTVWQWTTGSPGTWTARTVTQYYTNMIVPRSLRAKVTAKPSTNVCTLDTAATVTATNAEVVVDMSTVLNRLGQVYSNPSSAQQINNICNPTTMRIYVPAGDYPVCGWIKLPTNTVTEFYGDGVGVTIFRSIAGIQPVGLIIGTNGTNTHDFSWYGNAWQQKYGLGWGVSSRFKGWNNDQTAAYEEPGSIGVTETAITSGPSFPHGLSMYQVADCNIYNVHVEDTWQQAIAASFSGRCHAWNFTIHNTEPIRQYIQWQLHWTDYTGVSGVRDVWDGSVTSDYLGPGWEVFKATNTWFDNITGLNVISASNGSELCKYTNCTWTIEGMTQYIGPEGAASSSNNPIININNNIGVAANLVDGGFIVEDCTIVCEAPINASNDLLGGYIISGQTPNCQGNRITATYPDWATGGREHNALASNGANADFTDCVIYGKSKYQMTGSGQKIVAHGANSTIASGSSNTNVLTYTAAGVAITPADITGPT